MQGKVQNGHACQALHKRHAGALQAPQCVTPETPAASRTKKCRLETTKPSETSARGLDTIACPPSDRLCCCEQALPWLGMTALSAAMVWRHRC